MAKTKKKKTKKTTNDDSDDEEFDNNLNDEEEDDHVIDEDESDAEQSPPKKKKKTKKNSTPKSKQTTPKKKKQSQTNDYSETEVELLLFLKAQDLSLNDIFNQIQKKHKKNRTEQGVAKKINRLVTVFHEKFKSFQIKGEGDTVLIAYNLDIIGRGELKNWQNDKWDCNGIEYNREFCLIRLDEIFTGFNDIEIFQCGTKVKLGTLKHYDIVWPNTEVIFNFLDTNVNSEEPYTSQNFLNWFKIFRRRNITQSTINTSKYKIFGSAQDVENQLLDDDLLIGENSSKSSNVFFRSLLAKSHVSNLMGYANHSAQFIDLTLQMKQSHVEIKELIMKASRLLDYYFTKYAIKHTPQSIMESERYFILRIDDKYFRRKLTWSNLNGEKQYSYNYNNLTINIESQEDFDSIPQEVTQLHEK